MSGTAKKDQPPKNDAELIRDQDRRIESLEASDAVRAGKWVFSTQEGTENLIASFEDGGSHVVAKKPEEGTGADDVTQDAEVPVVVQYEPPRIQVRRTTNMSVSPGLVANIVTYDSTVEFTEGTNPIIADTAAGTLTIGETGVYQITAEFQWQSIAGAGSGNTCDVVLEIQNGGFGIAQTTAIRVAAVNTAQTISVARPLNASQVLRMAVYHNHQLPPGTNVAINGGAQYSGDVSARFNITLVQAAFQADSGQPPDPTPIQ